MIAWDERKKHEKQKKKTAETGGEKHSTEAEILKTGYGKNEKSSKEPPIRKKSIPVHDLPVSHMTTSQLIYSKLPVRNIDYIPYTKATRHSYCFTMRRLVNNEIFTVVYSGKDLNEAMTIANRINFDSAVIVNWHEES